VRRQGNAAERAAQQFDGDHAAARTTATPAVPADCGLIAGALILACHRQRLHLPGGSHHSRLRTA
jgi:hypothetical protein